MSSDLETLVRRANPMARPDQLELLYGAELSSRLLGDIRKVDRMVETTEQRTPVPPTPRLWNRGWLLAAGVAVAVLLAGGLMVIVNPGSDSAAPPAGTDPLTVVNSAYESLNAGDIDSWLGHFADDAVIFGFDKEKATSAFGVLAAANYRAELAGSCRRLDATPQGMAQIECTITQTNDFHGGGGISLTRTETFVVGDDGWIVGAGAAVIGFTQPGYYVFNEAFWDWMRDTHPAVFAEIGPQLTTHLPSDPAHMSTALEYLDEFLAQSERYPVTNGG